MSASGPEAHDSLFERRSSLSSNEQVPPHLLRATLRLRYSPTYIIVGAYRLLTNKVLYGPAWDKCKHATQRGAIVGAIWALLTFNIQRKFIQVFLAKSPRITGLSNDTLFGFNVPFSLPTYAAVLFLGSQVTYILRFFLSRNIRIARERAWAHTLASRGKGPEFWQPYVEEWDVPPVVDLGTPWHRFVKKLMRGPVGFSIVRLLLIPFSFYPFVGILVAAWFKALRTAQNLHRQYFESKKMTEFQVAVFMEERKWDYRIFGFTAALLEGLPVIGLVFTVSNRVGAAMWAHDLEKKQHHVRQIREEREAKKAE